jgi:hypothetical protein
MRGVPDRPPDPVEGPGPFDPESIATAATPATMRITAATVSPATTRRLDSMSTPLRCGDSVQSSGARAKPAVARRDREPRAPRRAPLAYRGSECSSSGVSQ